MKLFESRFSNVAFEFQKKQLKISDVAIKMGVNNETILNILGKSGKNISQFNYSNYKLTENDLEILANAYVKSAKRHIIKEAKKQREEELPISSLLSAIASYFKSLSTIDESQYILRSKSNLPSEFLYDEFYFIIYSNNEELRGLSLNKIFSRFKIRLFNISKDLRKQLFSLILSNQYHIFPSEEESNRETKNTILGYSIKYPRRVATLSIYTYFNQEWKNIYNLLKTLKIVIYRTKINQNSLIYFHPIQLI